MKLELIDIKKSFAGKEVLHGINLETSSGSSTAFLGRNGAGKTTTIRILMDVFKADSGKILIDGSPIDRKEIKLGYLPEERGMYAKSAILDQLIYFGRIKGLTKKESHDNALELLEKVKLNEYKAKNLDTLSKGNQQKKRNESTADKILKRVFSAFTYQIGRTVFSIFKISTFIYRRTNC